MDRPRRSGLVAARGVVEVYPAGALAMWGLRHKGYKTARGAGPAAATTARREIMHALETVGRSWLIVSDDVRAACQASDDALDAFVSSLVACAAATDATLKPLVEQRASAQREGWIHLPSPDCLESLAPRPESTSVRPAAGIAAPGVVNALDLGFSLKTQNGGRDVRLLAPRSRFTDERGQAGGANGH